MEKSRVSIIVAAAENNAIGKDNQLLWHLPNDLRFFKQTTLDRSMIMGRKTFESLGKALPRRRNIVVTRQPEYSAPGAEVVHSLNEALALCPGEEEIFIAGGAEIYKLALPLSDRIYLTRVHADIQGDAYFVGIDEREWKLVSSERHPADDRHAFGYTFMVYERNVDGK